MGERKLASSVPSEQDSELEFWRERYPDAYRGSDGVIRSERRLLEATDQALAGAQFAYQVYDAEANERPDSPPKKPNRGKKPYRMPKSDADWNRTVEFRS